MKDAKNDSEGVLTSLRYNDAIFGHNNSNEALGVWLDRPSNSSLDVFVKNDDGSEWAVCHFSTAISLTDPSGLPSSGRYEEAIAVALAVHHLNQGGGTDVLVPDAFAILQSCPQLKFTLEHTDLETQIGVAVERVWEQTQRKQNRPCAFVGAYRSSLSIPTSLITGIRRIPQVGISTSHELDDKSAYPFFARTTASDYKNSLPILEFFRQRWGVQKLAVLHWNDAYGNAFAEGLREAVSETFTDMSLATVSLSYTPHTGDMQRSIEEAVESLKLTQFRFFFIIVFNVFDELMEEAYRQGIVGESDYVWTFSDTFEPEVVLSRSFESDSVLAKAYDGASLIGATAGIAGMLSYDSFAHAMRGIQNPADLEYLQQQMPPNPEFNSPQFLQKITSGYSAFFYDAALALGLAACRSIAGKTGSQLFELDGPQHYKALVEQEFRGVTGNIILDRETGTREATSTLFQVVNFRPYTNASQEVGFQQVVTHIYQNQSWNQLDPHYFQGGSTVVPPDLPPFTLEENFLAIQLRGFILTLCGLAMLLAVGFGLWTWRSRTTHVVRASQPFFLFVICAGSFVLAATIIPLSMDPSFFNKSTSEYDGRVACTMIPWLITMGFSLVFSALFTKIYRVNRILNNPRRFQRIHVAVKDVLVPMVALLSANILVLSLMTSLAPMEWEVTVKRINLLRDTPAETYGRCKIGGEQWLYIAALLLINVGTLCCTIFQAYQARNLSTEYAESHYIFKSLLSIVLVLLVCGPVMIMTQESPNVHIFVASAVVFICSTANLLWIFAPKVRFALKHKEKSGSSIRVSGLIIAGSERSTSRISDNNEGERILSRLSQKGLIVENDLLKRELQKLRQSICCAVGDEDNGDAPSITCESASPDDTATRINGTSPEDSTCREERASHVSFASPSI